MADIVERLPRSLEAVQMDRRHLADLRETAQRLRSEADRLWVIADEIHLGLVREERQKRWVGSTDERQKRWVDSTDDPACWDACPWGSNGPANNLVSAVCTERVGHTTPHRAPSGEVWPLRDADGEPSTDD